MHKKPRYIAFILLSTIWFTLGCSSKSSISTIEYDEVLHFNYDEEKSGEVDFGEYYGDNPSPLVTDLPDYLDSNLPDKLKQYEFESSTVPAEDFAELNSIFTCEVTNDNSVTDCLPIYRDVLVFRKQKEIVLVAQLCFGCQKFVFVGPWPDMQSFGQKGEFKKLETLLNKSTD